MSSERSADIKGEKVVRIAAKGDGVTTSGRFVPFAVPGDTVGSDGRITPGPEHVEPVCQHFGTCGGCQLQHASERALRDFVFLRVTEPLQRVGIVPAEVMPVQLSPAYARRRTALRATRTKGKVRIGYNAKEAWSIVDLQECPVLSPKLFALVAPLRELLGPHLDEGAAIGISMTETEGGVDLLLSNLKAREVPDIHGLTDFALREGLARLSLNNGGEIETLVQKEPPVVRFGQVPVVVPPGVFLQATPDAERILVEAVREIVGNETSVADLFCGIGTFSLPLARQMRILAADAAKPAIDALSEAVRNAGLSVEVVHRDLFRQPLAGGELARFTAIILDPPRAGAQAQTRAIADSRVPLVAAVSCNPATFARDAKTLVQAGFTLTRIWPIGQFRWSTHVELVAEFKR